MFKLAGMDFCVVKVTYLVSKQRSRCDSAAIPRHRMNESGLSLDVQGSASGIPVQIPKDFSVDEGIVVLRSVRRQRGSSALEIAPSKRVAARPRTILCVHLQGEAEKKTQCDPGTQSLVSSGPWVPFGFRKESERVRRLKNHRKKDRADSAPVSMLRSLFGALRGRR